MQVEDSARSLDQLVLLSGAGWEVDTEELLVFADEVLELALLGGDLVESVNVEFAKLLDVDWATVIVGLVVVLGVVLVDLGSLGVVKAVPTRQSCPLYHEGHQSIEVASTGTAGTWVRSASTTLAQTLLPRTRTGLDSLCNLVGSKLFAPLLVGLPHNLGLGNVKFACTEETEQSLVVEAVVADRGLCGLEVGRDGALGGQFLAELGESSCLCLVTIVSRLKT